MCFACAVVYRFTYALILFYWFRFRAIFETPIKTIAWNDRYAYGCLGEIQHRVKLKDETYITAWECGDVGMRLKDVGVAGVGSPVYPLGVQHRRACDMLTPYLFTPRVNPRPPSRVARHPIPPGELGDLWPPNRWCTACRSLGLNLQAERGPSGRGGGFIWLVPFRVHWRWIFLIYFAGDFSSGEVSSKLNKALASCVDAS